MSFDVAREILKVIAVLTMTIDHVGAILFREFLVLRVVGRVAFPLFCYLLVLGVEGTRNRRDYLVRLGSFGVLSQIPYFLAFGIGPFERLNILFTLFFGASALLLFKTRNLLLILPVLAAVALNSEGWLYGIAFIGCMQVLRENTELGILVLFTLNTPFLIAGDIQFLSLAALPLIVLHKVGWFRITVETTKDSVYFSWKKYFFYVYYPLHLTTLFVIDLLH
jgi:hypothetical protein